MKRLFGLLVIIFLGMPQLVKAQDFDELFNDFMKQGQESFNEFVNKSQQTFNGFSDSISQVFADAMVANMKTFTSSLPMVRDSKPKPQNPPKIKNEDVPELPSLKPQTPSENPELNPVENPTYPTPEESSNDILPANQFNTLAFNIFGEQISWTKKTFPDKLNGISSKDVCDFWKQINVDDCQEMLQQCHIAQQEHAFNDWALYQLVLRMAQQLYEHQYDEQVIMTVYLLNQLGLEAKVGIAKTHLFCLIAIDQQVYFKSFMKSGDKIYYLFEINPQYLDIDGSELLFDTYEIPVPIINTHSLDINIQHPLKFTTPKRQNKLDIQINLNMINLYETYPEVDFVVYANATPSDEFRKSVKQAFYPHLKSKPIVEAVSFLLTNMYNKRYFDYATDEDQFGKEKTFFCEENFYFPNNDCEDRAILFSFLVRYLLHLDVVLIDYPGHLATAVHFPTGVEGEYVLYKGKKYVICDPTYEGASIGMEMPQFTPDDRTVIPLDR